MNKIMRPLECWDQPKRQKQQEITIIINRTIRKTKATIGHNQLMKRTENK